MDATFARLVLGAIRDLWPCTFGPRLPSVGAEELATMSDVEGKRTQREAQAQAGAPMTSRRVEIWAAMMRYLSGEAAREHGQAEEERAGEVKARRPGKQR
jgi:hypothetical protein